MAKSTRRKNQSPRRNAVVEDDEPGELATVSSSNGDIATAERLTSRIQQLDTPARRGTMTALN